MPNLADKHADTKRFLIRDCTKLTVDEVDWTNASDPKRYNCFGYAVGVLKWWEPYRRDRHGVILNPRDYWPKGISSKYDVDAYAKAAESLGFCVCQSGWEPSFEKIVLFYLRTGGDTEFTHAARQVSPDRWKSKFGALSDFEHPENIGCNKYGDGRLYLKRLRIAQSR